MEKHNKYLMVRGWCLRVLLFLYDVIVINLAYFLAIVLRFSDSDSFSTQGLYYSDMFRKFAPWYTIVCLVMFLAFRLYGAVWRYAGLNDAKKLVMISILTCVFYVVGSLLMVGRMPISVYILGAGIQFAFVSAPRLLPRYILENYGKTKSVSGNEINIPLMLIGVCENTRIIQSKIEKDGTNIVKPIFVADCMYGYTGKTFNGLPVICGEDSIREAVNKYDIRSAIIADYNLPKEFLDKVHVICEERSIDLRGFVIGTEYHPGRVGLKELLRLINSPVVIMNYEGEENRYNNGNEALQNMNGECNVENILVQRGMLGIRIGKRISKETPDSNAWIEQYRKETGDDISFF